MQKFPNILFLGNGLLRLQGEDSWEDLINTLSRGKYKDEPFDALPLNFRIVAKTEDNVDVFLKENKQKFYGKPLCDTALKVCEQLLDIGFDEIITTNYGYEIENVCTSLLRGELKKTNNKLGYIAQHTSGSKKCEPKYLLHTYNQVDYNNNNQVDYNNKAQKIWHIHGEAKKPNSMILGAYYYGTYLNKLKNTLDNREDYRRRVGLSPLERTTWIESFLYGNVYMLGFGCDFSEWDIWWLLNRKKREKNVHGKTYYFSIKGERPERDKLLDVLGVEVVELDRFDSDEKNKYKDAYLQAVEHIRGLTC